MRMIKAWFRRGGILAAGLLLCSGLVATPAMAASITYNFSGDVTGVDSLVSSQFNNSMTMSGSMTVDMVDQDPGSDSYWDLRCPKLQRDNWRVHGHAEALLLRCITP